MKSTLYKEEISLKSKKTASNDAITNFKNETKILLTEGKMKIKPITLS